MISLSRVRGITIRQPWAAAIVHGQKRVENRPRRWPLGTYLIHSGLTWDLSAHDDPIAGPWLVGCSASEPWLRGHVLGVANVVDCHRAAGGCCGPWGLRGAVHLVLADVVALPEPVPCRGALGAWQPPAVVLAAVRHQLEVRL